MRHGGRCALARPAVHIGGTALAGGRRRLPPPDLDTDPAGARAAGPAGDAGAAVRDGEDDTALLPRGHSHRWTHVYVRNTKSALPYVAVFY